MHKHCLLLTFLLSGVFCVSAQEEIYFNDTNIDRKDIKVDKTVQGVYISTELINYFFNMLYLDMAYFRDDRIAPTLTLHTTAGLQHSVYWTHKGINSSGQEYTTNGGTQKPYYGLKFRAEIAPRWYFSHRPRYQHNRRVNLNSGWFVGLPLRLAVPLLSQPLYSFDKWLPQHVSVILDLWAQIGFRYAFTSHFFIESSISYTPFFIYAPFTTDSQFGWKGYVKWHKKYDEFTEHFRLELKAAYTF